MATISRIRTCRWCNSPIVSEEEYCKHCHEYQNDKTNEKISLKDPTLSTSDWIVMVFSQSIGMLMAMVYFVKGENLRGIRLLKYSFILMFCKIIASYPVYYIFKTFHKLIRLENIL